MHKEIENIQALVAKFADNIGELKKTATKEVALRITSTTSNPQA